MGCVDTDRSVCATWRVRKRRVVGYNIAYACTGVASLDCCYLPAEAEIGGEEAVSVCLDAGTVVPVQFGLRGLREDSVSPSHFEEGAVAGGVLQGGGGVRDADGVDTWRRAFDAFAD